MQIACEGYPPGSDSQVILGAKRELDPGRSFTATNSRMRPAAADGGIQINWTTDGWLQGANDSAGIDNLNDNHLFAELNKSEQATAQKEQNISD